ncbi:MAG: PAS domain S-box protein [Deltaproteobacteria bacterium]|nr:PAS domain S-box protein [Deltaproteobacteria bacterium]
MNTDSKIIRFPSGTWHLLAVIVTTFVAIVVSIYYLRSGRFIVFQNLFYFPIIIACVYYLRKGFVFSVLLALFYLFLIFAYTSNSTIIREAIIRVAIFIMIAGVVSFLSLKRQRSEEGQNRARSWQEGINRILGLVLEPVPFDEKLKRITDGVVETFGADFCRIWIIGKGDLCSAGCMHAEVLEGPHVCRYRDKCLYLKASSGRYTHIDGKVHRRVPFDAYKIGRIASGEEMRFLTNDVRRDPRVHNHEWAESLGLVAFAGYQLRPTDGETLGVLALFAKFEISPDMDVILEGLSRAIALVIQKDIVERALAERNETLIRIQKAIESSSEAIGMASPQGSHFYQNKAFLDLFEYSVEEFNNPLAPITVYADPEVGREVFETIMQGDPWMGETIMVAKGGRRFPVFLRADAVKDDNGNIIGLIGIHTDITEKKLAEEKLNNQMSFISALLDTIPSPIFYKDTAGKYLGCNRAYEEIIGKSREEIVGKDIYDLYPAEIADLYAEKDRELYEQPGSQSYDGKFKVADGTVRDVIISKATYTDTSKNVAGLVGIFIDITERKEAERIYKVLAESSFAGVYVVQDGIFRYLNKNAALYAEYDPEELIGSHASVLVHPEDKAHTRRRAREMLNGQRRTPYEFRIVTKSGGVRWIMETSSAIEYQGRPAILGNSMDVTEKMNMEKALMESEARYRQLFENAVEGFFQSTPQGTYISVNPAFARMYGYAFPEEMIAAVTNIGAQLYVYQEDRREIGNLLETQVSVEDFEAEFLMKDGARIWGSINARAVRDDRGLISYYEGTIVDITERKRAEEEFRRQYRFLRTLLDSIPVPIYYLDARGTCGGCNQAFADFIARTTEEIIGTPLHELWQEGIDDSGQHLLWRDGGALEGQVYETILTRADAVPRNVIVAKAPFFNLDGSRGGEIGSFIDITDRKEVERELEIYRHHLEDLVRERTDGLELEIAEHRRTEQALRRAKDDAEAANRAKSAFLANMSHELRTPLNAVIGFSDVLNKQYFGPLNDKQEEYVQDIAASGQHLLELINEILDLAKIESGKDDLYYGPISLPELLVNSLSMIKEKARRHDIEVCVEAEERLAGITVTADARKLKQVLYNLLSNATKFTPDGGRIAVLARAIDDTASGEKSGDRFIEVSVTDTGVGLAPEDLEKIFEAFYQVYDPTRGKNPGTGLGLSLSRRIIAMHGGRIWAESAGPGQGSAFIFRIPCAPPQDIL